MGILFLTEKKKQRFAVYAKKIGRHTGTGWPEAPLCLL
jgi:hypothetical protein